MVESTTDKKKEEGKYIRTKSPIGHGVCKKNLGSVSLALFFFQAAIMKNQSEERKTLNPVYIYLPLS